MARAFALQSTTSFGLPAATKTKARGDSYVVRWLARIASSVINPPALRTTCASSVTLTVTSS